MLCDSRRCQTVGNVRMEVIKVVMESLWRWGEVLCNSDGVKRWVKKILGGSISGMAELKKNNCVGGSAKYLMSARLKKKILTWSWQNFWYLHKIRSYHKLGFQFLSAAWLHFLLSPLSKTPDSLDIFPSSTIFRPGQHEVQSKTSFSVHE